MAAGVKSVTKRSIGYNTADDIAALRFMNSLYGVRVNPGPLYVYTPANIFGAAVADVGLNPPNAILKDAIKLWEAAYGDWISSKESYLEWNNLLYTRGTLAAAPLPGTYGILKGITEGKSQSQGAMAARKRLWLRLAKYGAVYGINVNSMARALTTELTARFNQPGGAGYAANIYNLNVGPGAYTVRESLTAADLQKIGPSSHEVYTLMIGAPPINDPSSFTDGGLIPEENFMRRSSGYGGRNKKRRRKYY